MIPTFGPGAKSQAQFSKHCPRRLQNALVSNFPSAPAAPNSQKALTASRLRARIAPVSDFPSNPASSNSQKVPTARRLLARIAPLLARLFAGPGNHRRYGSWPQRRTRPMILLLSLAISLARLEFIEEESSGFVHVSFGIDCSNRTRCIRCRDLFQCCTSGGMAGMQPFADCRAPC